MRRSNRLGTTHAHDHGGDNERLADAIFVDTGVQAKVHLRDGVATISVVQLADYYIARAYLVKRGFDPANVRRFSSAPVQP